MADDPKTPEAPPVGVAAEALIQLAGKFQAVLDVAHALKGMTSIDNAIAERKAALVQATKAHEDAKKALVTTQASLTALHSEILKAESDHKQAMADLKAKTMAEARAEAQKIVEAAQSDATTKVTATTHEINVTQTAHASHMQVANARLATANREASEIEIKLAAARTEYEALSKKIADLKRSAAQLAA